MNKIKVTKNSYTNSYKNSFLSAVKEARELSKSNAYATVVCKDRVITFKGGKRQKAVRITSEERYYY